MQPRRLLLTRVDDHSMLDDTGRKVALAEAVDQNGVLVLLVLVDDAPTLPDGGGRLTSAPENAPEHDLLREEDW
jgi:hypothetical protein